MLADVFAGAVHNVRHPEGRHPERPLVHCDELIERAPKHTRCIRGRRLVARVTPNSHYHVYKLTRNYFWGGLGDDWTLFIQWAN